MDIQFTEEQELLRSSVQRLLRDQYDFDARRKIVASEEGFEPQAMGGVRRTRPARRAVLGRRRRTWWRTAVDHDHHAGVRPSPRGRAVCRNGGARGRPDRERRLAGADSEAYLPQIIAGEIDLGAGLGGRTLALRPQQRHDNGAASGRQLCAERHQGGGDSRALGRQVDRLGAHIRRATRSRRRQPVRGRSPCAPIFTCRASRPSTAGAPPRSR